MSEKYRYKEALRSQNSSSFRLYYHLVLVTKYRRKAINRPIRDRLDDIFKAVLNKWRCELVEFGAEEDHVHLLIDAHPALDLSSLVNNLKTVSSRRIRSEFPEHLKQFYWKPFFWSSGYAVLSAGSAAPLEILKRYIQSQSEPEQ